MANELKESGDGRRKAVIVEECMAEYGRVSWAKSTVCLRAR